VTIALEDHPTVQLETAACAWTEVRDHPVVVDHAVTASARATAAAIARLCTNGEHQQHEGRQPSQAASCRTLGDGTTRERVRCASRLRPASRRISRI